LAHTYFWRHQPSLIIRIYQKNLLIFYF
jgi:hypothetical protein